MNLILIFSFIYLLLLLLTIFVSQKLNFFDNPSSLRKIQKFKVMNTSGVSLYIFCMIIINYFEFSKELENIIALGFFIVVCGFIDDQKSLTPGVKLVLLIVPVIYLILNGYQLDDLGNYEFIGKIELGKFGLIFTILACGLLINGYNYIDGIDGLLILNILCGVIYILFLINISEVKNFFYFFSIPLILNLIFNFLPSNNRYKIFLGDGGSLFLGFFISFSIIYLYKYQNIHPAYLIWICWYPVFDFLFVTFYRIKIQKDFFQADKLHFHHYILLRFNNSHISSSLVITTLNAIIILIGYLTTTFVGNLYSLLLFILLFLIFSIIRYFILKNEYSI